jgi:cell division protein FtsW (lipid II flippase)
VSRQGAAPDATQQSRAVGAPANPRMAEAKLLALAVVVVTAGSALLSLSENAAAPTEALIFGGVVAGIALVAHLAVRSAAPDADPVLLPLALLLNGLGLIFVRRVDLVRESELAVAQTLWTVVSVAFLCAVILLVRRVDLLSRYQYTFGLATLVLLVLPMVPGLSAGIINGARLWVRIAGMTLQPGEIAKITMVLFLAGYLERKRALLSVATQRVGPFLLPAARHLAPLLLATGAALVVMAGLRDLGSALLFFGAFIAMLYVATGRLAYPAIGAGFFAVGSFIVYHLFGHVRVRIRIWIDPWDRVADEGYQIAQSLFAFGTGGLTGTGLGFGRPQDIPFSETDAIFAVVGEELGLLGATAMLVAFVLLVVRGFKIALTARDEFSTLLALGLTVIIGLQTFIIIGGLTRLVPLTGITLPFVSYGGSSLLSNFVLVALLLRISDESRGAARGRPAGRRAEVRA